MLSVIIPSYKDPLLKNTVESILQNATGEIEVICVLDGYWTSPVDDPRVRVVHLGKNRGMRGAINAGARVAKGEFLMRTDEHCKYAKGFDTTLISVCQPNWIITARRYYLDPIKWEKMDLEPVNYERLVTQKVGEHKKFTGFPSPSPYKEALHESQAMQGSFWIMPRKWWEEVIVELDDKRYGPLIQDSHEMVFKTWKAGGKLMVNEDTWFAHKHVSFTRTHNFPRTEGDKAARRMYDDWHDYYRELKEQWKKSA